MDDYMFDSFVGACDYYYEETHYVEILNYSDPSYNTCEQHVLSADDFDNFIHRRGAFEPPKLRPGVKFISGLRLILQQNAAQNETFSPNVITLTHGQYQTMVRGMNLPFRAIEGTSVVGPFFWSSFDQDDDDPHLQIIYRKSDVRKRGKTRGWETMFSHTFSTALTTGYVKGTPSSKVVDALAHVKSCASQVGHPLLLPLVLLSHELSPENEVRQRSARDWLRRLEHAISAREEIREDEGYLRDGILDLDGISRDMYECNSQVLWKKPGAYIENVKEFERAMERFRDKKRELAGLGGGEEQGGGSDDAGAISGVVWDKEVDKLHRSMLARLEFYMVKVKGLENYSWTTLERLRIQREALYNISAIRESKLSLQMAKEQKHLAHMTKHDGTAMKTLSLLGAIFLPGTYLASVFSMTFFNFDQDAEAVVSADLWIYFAMTVPLTAAIVGTWVFFNQRRKRRFLRDQDEVKNDIESMEREIMATMRRRTLRPERTWTSASPKVG